MFVHPPVRSFVETYARGYWPFVVEIGSRNINGGVRDLIDCGEYVGVDRAAGPGVDVVADAHDWLPPRTPDLVVCCEVLEHCPEPEILVGRMVSWLGREGHLIVTCAIDPRAPHGCDGGPVGDEFYENPDWRRLLGAATAAGATGLVALNTDLDAGDLMFCVMKL